MIPFFGEIAAIATAVTWATSCQINAFSAKILGGQVTALVRLPVSMTFMGLLCLLTSASLNFDATLLIFLFLSGLSGITLGDYAYYRAVPIVGPSLSLLIQSLAACLTALMGLVFLGETLGFQGWLGILTATLGVVITVTDGRNVLNPPGFGVITKQALVKGVLFAFVSAVGMALSFIFMKKALTVTQVNPLWASFFRVSLGTIVLWSIGYFSGWLKDLIMHVQDHSMPWRKIITAGIIGGSGTILSLVAVQYTETAIAATLVGLQTVVIVPMNALVNHRRPAPRQLAGAIIAFIGIAVLILR